MPTFATLTVKDGTGTNTIGTWTGNLNTTDVREVIDYIVNTYHVYINHLYSPDHRAILDNYTPLSDYFSDGWGDVWDATTTIYAWENVISEIYVWERKDNYKAMQWPCPNGFHISLYDDWSWVRDIMDSLSLSPWDSWRINLHLPFAGKRQYSNAWIYWQGTIGYYWNEIGLYSGQARYLYLNSWSIVNDSTYRADAQSIRWFKDSYVEPTSSWTVIQGSLWSAWIFWNQSEWLISITAWYWRWYTMMDKNLWATTVYNDWDTLTQANMWNLYQWWNNYGFASTWTISNTSSTQVNASTYWPWNYYNSGTFIMPSASPHDWSSVRNDDLRWWDTGIIREWMVYEVYKGTTLIREE